jgi:hypothetical protein
VPPEIQSVQSINVAAPAVCVLLLRSGSRHAPRASHGPSVRGSRASWLVGAERVGQRQRWPDEDLQSLLVKRRSQTTTAVGLPSSSSPYDLGSLRRSETEATPSHRESPPALRTMGARGRAWRLLGQSIWSQDAHDATSASTTSRSTPAERDPSQLAISSNRPGAVGGCERCGRTSLTASKTTPRQDVLVLSRVTSARMNGWLLSRPCL